MIDASAHGKVGWQERETVNESAMMMRPLNLLRAGWVRCAPNGVIGVDH